MNDAKDAEHRWINKVVCSDALAELRRLPNGLVDIIVTSPPYYRQRDYRQRDIASEMSASEMSASETSAREMAETKVNWARRRRRSNT